MVKISLEIGKFHPAIMDVLVAELGVDADKVLVAVNTAIREAGGEATGEIRAKGGKDSVTITASGKLAGLKFRKDSPAGLLARINWYLTGSSELFCRVEKVTLPHSVLDWLKAKEFAFPAQSPA